MTSADVVFAYDRLKNLQGAASYLMDGLTVSADGEDTVVISSEVPQPGLLQMLTAGNFSIYDSEAIKAEGGISDETAATEDTAADVFAQKSFGTGAYSLKGYEPNAEVNLAFSSNWRGDEPDFTSIIIRNSRSIQQQVLNVQNGGSDLTISLSAPQVEELDASKVNVLSQPLPQLIYMALTNSEGPTTNADFRKAIALGLDYEGLVEVAGKGAAQATGVIPTTVLGALSEGDALQRDVEAAKQALADSGMADQELSISFGSDYTVGGQDMGLFAQKIQSDLQEIGMNVTLDGAPTQVSRTANQEGKIQAALWPWPPDYADPSQFLIYNPGGLLATRTHWTAEEAPEIDALAQAAQLAIDPADRETAYQEWARAIRDTNRFIAVVEVPQALVTSKRVGNLNMDVMGTVHLDALTLEQ
ncbi:ABC transporter substrate-binding protein [Leucobacter soli]|uniref:ABC transporter substrate-binding protein n=1 Tax=Leucobacter soli TaxID=2812850 RepID=UPI003606A06C